VRTNLEVDPALLTSAVNRLRRSNDMVRASDLRAEAPLAAWCSDLDGILSAVQSPLSVPASQAAAIARRHLDAVDRAWNLVVASRPHLLAWPTWFERLAATVEWARALAIRAGDAAVEDRATRSAARVAAGVATARQARERATLAAILSAHDDDVGRLEREYRMREPVGGRTLAGRRHLWRLADRLVELEGQLAELHGPFPGPVIGSRRRRVLDVLHAVEGERQTLVAEIVATAADRGKFGRDG
jgi:hypothetical protein